MHPSVSHGCGHRWQVRWRDASGTQRKKNFEVRSAAVDFDAKVKVDMARGDYVDPAAGKIKLGVYAQEWYGNRAFNDPGTAETTESRVRLHIVDDEIGDRELRAIKPSTVEGWVKRKRATLSASTVAGLYAVLSGVLAAAVDDGRLAHSPMDARSTRRARPVPPRRKVVPWPLERVTAVRAAMLARYAAMVDLGAYLGMRQGETFATAVDDIDFLGRIVHVRRQVKIVNARLVFAPPKGGKERDVPLPSSVALRLSAHIAEYPPVAVTLPWLKPGGKPRTAKLLFTSAQNGALSRHYWNVAIWRPALEEAGVLPERKRGQHRPVVPDTGFHALRHHFASALLGNHVDIRALAEYLGHHSAAFTLAVYAHLMPDAADRMRKAVDDLLDGQNAWPVISEVP